MPIEEEDVLLECGYMRSTKDAKGIERRFLVEERFVMTNSAGKARMGQSVANVGRGFRPE